MDAPEKIYLQQYDENTLICLNEWNISDEWSNKPCNEKVATNIEYVHTDAFIEKAEKYLLEHLIDYWAQVVTDEIGFIEGFKEYMKGE